MDRYYSPTGDVRSWHLDFIVDFDSALEQYTRLLCIMLYTRLPRILYHVSIPAKDS